MLALKRVYDKAAPEDGVRFLVERLWPRGIKKTDLRLDDWLKDVAPTTKLRQWFSHDPKKWTEFQKRYFAELDSAIRRRVPRFAAPHVMVASHSSTVRTMRNITTPRR
jgi:uncharacterized protein YeaO (DUF488 family)